ncbi:hypothetical protein BDA99DRAFT_536039 [Phascolomyces articulosus]|uniref:Uncharacterized protein n=1 Tax=Phascolomyces articulosus TaxID=60185 RepID=A0AAD5PF87_9FUNG|nr:hypothetical protein BDA99DRAFT_536039 [Phascolomyces articulosus]
MCNKLYPSLCCLCFHLLEISQGYVNIKGIGDNPILYGIARNKYYLKLIIYAMKIFVLLFLVAANYIYGNDAFIKEHRTIEFIEKFIFSLIKTYVHIFDTYYYYINSYSLYRMGVVYRCTLEIRAKLIEHTLIAASCSHQFTRLSSEKSAG